MLANFNISECDLSHSWHSRQSSRVYRNVSAALSESGEVLLLNFLFQLFDLVIQLLLVFLFSFHFFLKFSHSGILSTRSHRSFQWLHSLTSDRSLVLNSTHPVSVFFSHCHVVLTLVNCHCNVLDLRLSRSGNYLLNWRGLLVVKCRFLCWRVSCR